MKLIILTTMYNCSTWLEKCILTIKNQTYNNFECYLLNDISTDNSIEIAKSIINEDARFHIINNTKKHYQPGNYDQIIRSDKVDDHDIIVEVDGDDWLPDQEVFARIIKYYSDSSIWLTYGQFIYSSGQLGFAEPVNFKQLRTSRFTATHLRTWKAKLWRLIKPEDLLVNGKYPECAGDVFFMLPMIEMCGPDHALFVPDINYVYNFENPIGDSKGDRLALTQFFANIGRNKPPYERIKNL
jgi:glycosyltransferase involved in cell wall biosynthesis